jgi:hypothetical protein
MTSEVALLNRLGVALAADSATTVSYWESGERKDRYFKGANKIFNLSSAQPVGLMTYGSAFLQKMHWEVLVKAYRDDRGSSAKEKLADYPVDLFKFLAKKELFPIEVQERQLVSGVCETAGNISARIVFDKAVRSETDLVSRKRAADTLFESISRQVREGPLISPECDKIFNDCMKMNRAAILTEYRSGELHNTYVSLVDSEKLVDVAVRAYFQEHWTDMERTGIAIAGFGDNEFFPSLEQYECFGVAKGQVIFKRLANNSHYVSFDIPSTIVPIAQDEMVYTFMMGASIDALVTMNRTFLDGMSVLIDRMKKDGPIPVEVDSSAHEKQVADEFNSNMRKYTQEKHL